MQAGYLAVCGIIAELQMRLIIISKALNLNVVTQRCNASFNLFNCGDYFSLLLLLLLLL